MKINEIIIYRKYIYTCLNASWETKTSYRYHLKKFFADAHNLMIVQCLIHNSSHNVCGHYGITKIMDIINESKTIKRKEKHRNK